MAAAYSARKLGVPATIIVPDVTPRITVEKMQDEGATVIIHGKVSDYVLLINPLIALGMQNMTVK